MRNSFSCRSGRTAIVLLLSIAAAILYSAVLSEQELPNRVHPRFLQPDAEVAGRGLPLLNIRVAKLTYKPASDDEYNKAAQKGQKLMCWMRDPNLAGEYAHSKWTKFEELEKWGWTSPPGPPSVNDLYSQEQDPGMISLYGSGWGIGKKVWLQHTEFRDMGLEGGKHYRYPGTRATYQNRFYADQGVIVGDYNWSPTYKVKAGVHAWDKTEDRIPQLNRLSDVWWLCWAKICSESGNDPRQLRYVVQHHVVNTPTLQILARVLQKHFGDDPDVSVGRAPGWPGKVITKDMDGFAALLGTPNIWGTPFMLVQRHVQLGKKQVSSITVYDELPGNPYVYPLNMIVELEDVTDGN